MIIKDSTNTKLGLVVTTSVNSIENLDIQDPDDTLEALAAGVVLATKGTVLYGNNTSEEVKKVKLKIYYTEPDN